jgi:CheY-like chemotaxis protein/anti-sigma regulatory factor (Ser/Thr protein kinase)
MSKIESGKLELVPEEFDFKRMLQRVSNVVNFRVAEKRQRLTVSVDGSMPRFLVGDDQRLAQVITNLVGNAVKFTPEEGDIRIGAHLLDERDGICTIEIAVTDTGIGISAEQQARLFQSFQQAERDTARKYGGTGLGLAISKNIVEMMGGKVWINSELGKGATFAFTVKLGCGENAAEEPFGHGNSAMDVSFEGHRILHAEDAEINREIILALLEPTNIAIDFVCNGQEAVDAFKKSPERYDLILMDLEMPQMDGYEATRIIRALDTERAQSIPIIAVSANVFKEDIAACLACGMNGHLGKPVALPALLAELQTHLPKK